MRGLWLVGGALLMLTFAGCGMSSSPLCTVTGRVTVNGVPLEKGQIALMAKDGAVAPAGGAISGGQYRVQVLPGTKLVEISAMREEGPVDNVMGAPQQKQYLPAKYNTATTLVMEVTSGGANTFDFALEVKE